MRLWHEALIPYLPRQQLLGLHREVCALRGKGWGKPHSVVNYVFEHPFGWLVAYHNKVMAEMDRRGYKHEKLWDYPWYRGKNMSGLNSCDLASAWIEIMDKQDRNDPIYPEHNAAYLQECLDNLAGKGIHIDMEAVK